MVTNSRESFYRRLADTIAGERPCLVVLEGGPGWGKATTLLAVGNLLSKSKDSLPVYLPFDNLCYSPEFFINHSIRIIGEQISLNSESAAGKYRSITEVGCSNVLDVFKTLFQFTSNESLRLCLLLDEIGDLWVLKSFPGHGRIVDDFYDLISKSNTGILATTAFPGRIPILEESTTRLVECIEIPLLDVEEIESLAGKTDLPAGSAMLIHQFTMGIPGYVDIILNRLEVTDNPFTVDDLIELMKPDGALEMKCRYNYEYLVQRSRGEGIVRHLLSVLAFMKRPKLTEIAEVLGRSLGVTKDYLKWLLAVGIIEVENKRYSVRDSLLSLWIQLYRSGRRPSRDEIREKIEETLRDLHAPVAEVKVVKRETRKKAKPHSEPAKAEESPMIILPRKQDIDIEELD